MQNILAENKGKNSWKNTKFLATSRKKILLFWSFYYYGFLQNKNPRSPANCLLFWSFLLLWSLLLWSLTVYIYYKLPNHLFTQMSHIASGVQLIIDLAFVFPFTAFMQEKQSPFFKHLSICVRSNQSRCIENKARQKSALVYVVATTVDLSYKETTKCSPFNPLPLPNPFCQIKIWCSYSAKGRMVFFQWS